MGQLGYYLFLIMGFLFLVNALVVAALAVIHRRRAIPVTAEVIAMRETTTSDGGPAFAPVFRIVDGQDAGRIWESWAASNPAMHAVGDILPASYNARTGVIQSGKVRTGSVMLAFGMFVASLACFTIVAVF